jgi:hypothetical protein
VEQVNRGENVRDGAVSRLGFYSEAGLRHDASVTPVPAASSASRNRQILQNFNFAGTEQERGAALEALLFAGQSDEFAQSAVVAIRERWHGLSADERLLVVSRCPDMFDPAASLDEEGNNVLHLASREGYLESVQKLLSVPGDVVVDATTNKGETALHLAVQHRHWDVAQELLKAGADPYAQRDDGETPYTLDTGANLADRVRAVYSAEPPDPSVSASDEPDRPGTP